MSDTKAVIFSDGKMQAIGNDGRPVPYGKLRFYDSISGDKVDTYTTSTMQTKNTYPIILSASGKGDVYVTDGQFDVTLQDKNGATVWTINNYIPAGGTTPLAPTAATPTREEFTGIVGNSIILDGTPLTTVGIHKNGLLLLEEDYQLDGKTIVFTDALIVTDEIIVEFSRITIDGTNEGIKYTTDIIENLLTLSIAILSVNVKGYSVINDGGGGTFNYVSTTDKATANGGTIIDPDEALVDQGNGIGSGCWVRQYNGAVSVKWFGAVCDGSDESGILLKVSNLYSNIEVDGITVGSDTTLTKENLSVQGGTINIGSGGRLILSGKHTNFSPTFVVCDTTLPAIQLQGHNSKVNNVIFSGAGGNMLLLKATENSEANNNNFEGTQTSTCITIESCLNCSANGNTMREHTGFGIQALLSTNITINDTVAKNTIDLVSVAATDGQAVYNVTLAKEYARLGVIITDDTGNRAVPYSTTNVEGEYEITITDTTVTGIGTLDVYASDALESIQVNSGCSNINIVGGSIKGTGDAGIVVGADYHYNGSIWVLDPGAVVESDHSENIIINGVSIADSMASNIAINNIRGSCIITNNIGEGAGKTYDVNTVNDCSFNVIKATVVSGNTAISQGYTRSGFAITHAQDSYNNRTSAAVKAELSRNVMQGVFKGGLYNFLTSAGQDYRNTGIRLAGESLTSFNFKAEVDDATITLGVSSYYDWIQSGNNLPRSGLLQMYGDNCLELNGTIAGAISTEISTLYYNTFKDSVVKVSFFGKYIAGTVPEIKVDMRYSGAVYAPIVIPVNSTDWEFYEAYFPIDVDLTRFNTAFTCDATGNALIDGFDISIVKF